LPQGEDLPSPFACMLRLLLLLLLLLLGTSV
jgi:hypothetical protein